VVLLADGTPYARVYVPEPVRVRFTAGRKASVSIDGVSTALEGTVRYVSAEATYTPYYALTQKDRSRLSYLAEVSVADPRAAALPAGVPVRVAVPEAQ
jgi:HlyD family secretion protein